MKEAFLLALARRDKSDLAGTVRAVTEASAEVLDVERSSVWMLADDERVLVLQDLFLRAEGRHVLGDRLHAEELPAYFAAMRERRTIPADDALTDPRTTELRGYLERHGILSMMDVPIWHRARLYGVLCNETTTARRWKPHELAFATNLSDLLSLSLEASERMRAEQSWAAVVGAIGEAVFISDAGGRIEPANPKMRELMKAWGGGATREEREGLFEFVDQLGRPLDLETHPGGVLHGQGVSGEVIGLRARATNELKYYRMTITPIHHPEHPEGRWVGVLFDLSDEVRFAQTKRQFLDDVAHELKTPVAIAKGYAHVLSRSADVPARHKESLQAIRRAADRMAELVHGLVDVSGILLGRLVLAHERLALSTVAERVRARLALEAPEHTVRLRVTEEVEVLGDPERLDLATRELADAIARAQPGHGSDVIAVGREGQSAVLTVRVKRSGLVSDLTDPGEDLVDEDDPTGLLSIVFREIVRAHDGQVCVRADEERTTIRVVFPAAGAP